MNHDHRRREHWSSQLGVVIAVAGAAIGLGNFLRFPGQVARYGGGAFMIPYFISLLIVGIPLAWTEWALGRFGGRRGAHSTMGIYREAFGAKIWGVFGGVMTLIPAVINMYYIFLEAWCLLYALQYLGGALSDWGLGGFSLFPTLDAGMKLGSPEEYAQYFKNFVGVAENGALFKSSGVLLLVATACCFAANFWLVYRGVSKGIERFCKIAAPGLLVCSLVIFARVLTFGNPTGVEGQSLLDGLGFMWNPTQPLYSPDGETVGRTTLLTTLANPDAWLAATSQIFFSISICLCLIAAYASYVKPKEDISLSCLTSAAANEVCEVILAGLTIIPAAVMFLGSAALADKLDSSFTMGFVVLPNVFSGTPGGQIFGFFFFFLLFLSGITSSIALAQPTVALAEEALDWGRGKSVLLALAVCLCGSGLVCWFTEGLAALDTFDFWAGQFAPFLFAIVQTALVAFVWGEAKLFEELDDGANMRVPRFVGKLVKYVSLPYLAIIFAFWTYKNLGAYCVKIATDPVARITCAFIAALAICLAVLSLRAFKRREREEAAAKIETNQERKD
ncbi:MAG: sodium:calcium symporter [Thermoguttaceae bacterium]|nr:sodium:calcium symporter [Thermoguttaceae bacterium]